LARQRLGSQSVFLTALNLLRLRVSFPIGDMFVSVYVAIFLLIGLLNANDSVNDESIRREKISVIVAVEEFQPAIYLKESLASIETVNNGALVEVGIIRL
jgi:hypothetical protein